MNTTRDDDLRFLSEMTRAGRLAPLIGGRYFVFFGTLLPMAYLVQWATLDGRFGLPPIVFALNWLVFGAAVGIGLPLLGRSLRHKPGRGSINNRVDGQVWMAAGFAIFAYAAGVFVATVVLERPPWLWDFIVAVAFAGYGIGFLTTGHIAEQGWMRLPAALSLGATAVVPALAGTPELYLFAATMIVLTALLPGIKLVREEPEALPETP